MFVVAVALQDGLRYGPLAAGLALVPLCAAYFVASLAGPRLVARFGRRVVVAGSLIQSAGLLALALVFRTQWSDVSAPALAAAMAVLGVGQGLVLPTLLRIVLSELPAAQAGVGGGAMVTTQQAGLALGVATLGTLFLTLLPSLGVQNALIVALLAQLATVGLNVVLTFRLPRVVR